MTLEDGSRHRARFLITAVGVLSAPTHAAHPGHRDLPGPVLPHPHWPHEPVSFAGKRVAVIGTGATGVQTITEVAKTVGHLTVFQRTPNWCAPLHNGQIDAEEQRRSRPSYPEIFARCQETFACFIHTADPRGTFEVTPEEREAFLEKLYAEPGFGIWQGNFRDMLTDREANAVVSEFVARKIRERVKDPAVAEKLIPKDHGFGTRRVPLETQLLRGLQPAQRPAGRPQGDADRAHHAGGHQDQRRRVRVRHHHLCDRLRRDHRQLRPHRHPGRRAGCKLKDKWADGPQTFSASRSTASPTCSCWWGRTRRSATFPRSIEYNVDWVTGLIRYMRERNLTRADARPEAVEAWTDHVKATGEGLLSTEVDSWMTGINSNVEGKQPPHHRALQRRRAGVPRALRRGGGEGLSGTHAGVEMHTAPCSILRPSGLSWDRMRWVRGGGGMPCAVLRKSRDWRRRRDSNPRYALTAYNGLANRRLQPLGHVSGGTFLLLSLT